MQTPSRHASSKAEEVRLKQTTLTISPVEVLAASTSPAGTARRGSSLAWHSRKFGFNLALRSRFDGIFSCA
jgi:hypothetical protein